MIHVSHPSVPWYQIRATEGWAGLQHLNVLRGWLSVLPPSDRDEQPSEPLLRTELLQGAFFTVLPPPGSPERKAHVPQWHDGNIYTLERAPVQLVKLPVSPTSNREMRYEVIICAPYEVCRSFVSLFVTKLTLFNDWMFVDTSFWRPLCVFLSAPSSNTQFLRLSSTSMLSDTSTGGRRNHHQRCTTSALSQTLSYSPHC